MEGGRQMIPVVYHWSFASLFLRNPASPKIHIWKGDYNDYIFDHLNNSWCIYKFLLVNLSGESKLSQRALHSSFVCFQYHDHRDSQINYFSRPTTHCPICFSTSNINLMTLMVNGEPNLGITWSVSIYIANLGNISNYAQ